MAKTFLVNGQEVVVDDCDAHHFEGRTWRLTGPTIAKQYLSSSKKIDGKKRNQKLHRLIVGAEPGEFVDHISGDTMDNRRANLRIVTHRQNCFNLRKVSRTTTSRFKGVSLMNSKWVAQINTLSGRLVLGRYDDEVAAAYAYDIASFEHHGEYGRRNFLPLHVGC